MKFIKKKFNYVILLAILSLGSILFFYKLAKIPSGFYIDEALPGYNAYSILLTGKDEYGKSYPLLFRFYGSYNPPLYTYLTVAPVAIFGLNIFSVRFISALAGLLSVIPYFFILRNSKMMRSKATLVVSAGLFIIQPWLILHSRVGYEVSLAFLVYSFGLFFLWRGLKKERFLAIGLILLSLSTYAAYTQRYLAPLVIVGFILIFKKLLRQKKVKGYLKTGLFCAILIQFPLLTLVNTPAFFPKSDMFSSLEISTQAEKILLPYPLASLLVFFREFLSQYFTYFSPRSLFFLPDPDLQRSIPGLSVFYFWMIIPFIVGLYYLWKNRKNSFSRFILLLLIVSPIPAAFTHDPFATHRAMPHFLPIMLIVALGINKLIKLRPKIIWIPAFAVVFLSSLLLLWRSYFVFLPRERARVWGYGYEQLAVEISKRKNLRFVVDQSRIKPSYINLAFFLQYPPEKYQAEQNQSIKYRYYDNQGFDTQIKYGNIENRNISWEKDIYKKQVLVGDEFAISDQQATEHFLEKMFEIRSPVDEIIFLGYKTNPVKKCEADPNNINCKGDE